MKKAPAAVVTGASSGIGRAVSAALIDAGWRVFGSVRKTADADEAREALGPAFSPLIFDVTDRPAIDAAATLVATELGRGRLAGLVNNAGVAVTGPMRYLPDEDLRRQFDINVFGVVDVTRAFLPLLGADPDRTGRPGRIVNMSSVAGRIAAPFTTPYAMSKHALEAFSDGLRRELMVHGVDVVTVGPGAVRTPIWAKAEASDFSQYKNTEYADALALMQSRIVSVGEDGLPVERIGAVVRDILTARSPRARYALVRRPVTGWLLPRLMPARMLDRAIAARFSLRRAKR